VKFCTHKKKPLPLQGRLFILHQMLSVMAILFSEIQRIIFFSLIPGKYLLDTLSKTKWVISIPLLFARVMGILMKYYSNNWYMYILVGTRDVRTQSARAQPVRAQLVPSSPVSCSLVFVSCPVPPVPVPSPCPCSCPVRAQPAPSQDLSQTDRPSELIYMIGMKYLLILLSTYANT
jgi:hypothetical protein